MIEPIYTGVAGTTARPKTQRIYRFPNGLGASALIQTSDSGEEWAELLPVKFIGPEPFDWDIIPISFSLPGFGGLVGTYMTPDEVQRKLAEIRDLDPAEVAALKGTES